LLSILLPSGPSLVPLPHTQPSLSDSFFNHSHPCLWTQSSYSRVFTGKATCHLSITITSQDWSKRRISGPHSRPTESDPLKVELPSNKNPMPRFRNHTIIFMISIFEPDYILELFFISLNVHIAIHRAR
jgi:hypothetical protein